MTRSRNASDATIDKTMQSLLEKIRRRVDPNYLQMFRCRGGCEDTGWVVVDSGISSSGQRFAAPTVKRCAVCGGKSSRRTVEVSGGSFS